MDNICIKYPTRKFDFSETTLTYPKSIGGGSYFTKILHQNSSLYLQIPKCTTKQGLIKSGKKMYCELILDNINEELVGWFEMLEDKCKELLLKHSPEWFGNSISQDDIDYAFRNTLKSYKSGKYSLVKTNIKMNASTETPILSCYDENQNPQSVGMITPETNIVAILEISGIQFTSRQFSIEIEMKQIMIVNDLYEEDVCFNKCVIKPRGVLLSSQLDSLKKEEPFAVSITEVPNMVDEIRYEKNKEDILEVEEEENNNPLMSSIEDIITNFNNNNSVLECPLSVPKQQPPINDMLEIVDISVMEEQPELKEIDCFDITPTKEIKLNKPEDIYYELYRKTKQKAKEALLEAKRIKEQYNLDVSDWDDSDVDSEDGY